MYRSVVLLSACVFLSCAIPCHQAACSTEEPACTHEPRPNKLANVTVTPDQNAARLGVKLAHTVDNKGTGHLADRLVPLAESITIEGTVFAVTRCRERHSSDGDLTFYLRPSDACRRSLQQFVSEVPAMLEVELTPDTGGTQFLTWNATTEAHRVPFTDLTKQTHPLTMEADWNSLFTGDHLVRITGPLVIDIAVCSPQCTVGAGYLEIHPAQAITMMAACQQ